MKGPPKGASLVRGTLMATRGLESLLLQQLGLPGGMLKQSYLIKCCSTQLGFSMKQNILLKDLKINYYQPLMIIFKRAMHNLEQGLKKLKYLVYF